MGELIPYVNTIPRLYLLLFLGILSCIVIHIPKLPIQYYAYNLIIGYNLKKYNIHITTPFYSNSHS
jgi:hypothetical protein